jgi:hypothetical protein
MLTNATFAYAILPGVTSLFLPTRWRRPALLDPNAGNPNKMRRPVGLWHRLNKPNPVTSKAWSGVLCHRTGPFRVSLEFDFSDDQPRVQEAPPREALEAIRAEVLAEKKKPPASEKATKVREKSKKA